MVEVVLQVAHGWVCSADNSRTSVRIPSCREQSEASIRIDASCRRSCQNRDGQRWQSHEHHVKEKDECQTFVECRRMCNCDESHIKDHCGESNVAVYFPRGSLQIGRAHV